MSTNDPNPAIAPADIAYAFSDSQAEIGILSRAYTAMTQAHAEALAERDARISYLEKILDGSGICYDPTGR